jgi:pimeloyl-ACP methyl ester carboxylesterase
MTRSVHNPISDLRGASRMVVDAITGLTGLVEAMHINVAEKSMRIAGVGAVGTAAGSATSVVYRSIRYVTRTVGRGVDLALGAVAPVLGDIEPSRERENVVAALNGVIGDYLAETGNPLAATMHLRSEGRELDLTRRGLAAAIRAPSSKALVLVHGLCRNELCWERDGHNHGAQLARDHSYTAVYLRYNTGLHISTNGRALAEMLEAMVAAWPVPLREVSILAHSMGGLVARSAHHHASAAGHAWPRKLRKLVFLGTPHHGAPLERAGHRVDLLLQKTRYTAPLALLGKVRSRGITDLRHGYLLEEDLKGSARFADLTDSRCPVPLPKRVRCYAIAGSIGRAPVARRNQLIGDGLVPVPSALGDHPDPRFKLSFPPSRQWTVGSTSHFGLLSRGLVYERIREWFGE